MTKCCDYAEESLVLKATKFHFKVPATERVWETFEIKIVEKKIFHSILPFNHL